MKYFEFGRVSDPLAVRLKATGYPFELKVFTGLGHGGLAGEHPAQFVEEVMAAYQKSLN